MPQTIHNIYLPFIRDLTYQTSTYMNGEILETQSGDIFSTRLNIPISKIFYADNIHVTPSELTLIQDFYQNYYLQKFRFKDKNNPQKILSVIETPNNLLTVFNVKNDNVNLLYFTQSAKIYQNNILIPDAILNDNLEVTFIVPPIAGSVIHVVLDYDYPVMFDYTFGLQSVYVPKTKTYTISFKLNSVMV